MMNIDEWIYPSIQPSQETMTVVNSVVLTPWMAATAAAACTVA
jgi:hypothetical protein